MAEFDEIATDGAGGLVMTEARDERDAGNGDDRLTAGGDGPGDWDERENLERLGDVEEPAQRDQSSDLDEAIAVYSADGQADDEAGNDAGAEELLEPGRPRDPGHTGMPHGPDAR
jgi:hypothetical protein